MISKPRTALLILLVGAIRAQAGEVLYNGIELPDEWPPRDVRFSRFKAGDPPPPPPYLSAPPKVIPIDVGRQLFVDDFLIEQTTLKRAFHRPEYYEGNPILKPAMPWETHSRLGPMLAPFSGGVFWDPKDGIFKMWHMAGYNYFAGLSHSKDGLNWTRPKLGVKGKSNIIAIPNNEKPGDWNWGNVQSVGGCCLVVGDRLHFYVSGRAGKIYPGSPGEDAGMTTGVAFLRRDGFASMNADDDGSLTTRPLSFKGKRLFVNLDAPDGELRAELLDLDGSPIAPFTRANCEPLKLDATLAEVRWQGAADLSAHAGKTVRLRFHLKQGSLYSFWVSPDVSGASHGYVAAGGPGFTSQRDAMGWNVKSSGRKAAR